MSILRRAGGGGGEGFRGAFELHGGRNRRMSCVLMEVGEVKGGFGIDDGGIGCINYILQVADN